MQVEIAPGVSMPLINLGTWQLGNGKPSDPAVGVPPWLQARAAPPPQRPPPLSGVERQGTVNPSRPWQCRD